MVPSNILNIFNQGESSTAVADQEICLPCQIMGVFTCFAGSAYFLSDLPFKDANPKQNPLWFRYALRTSGVALFGLGVYRGTEGWLWNTDAKYKDSFLK